MLKVWLVKFSNGEEWHIFGESIDVEFACIVYANKEPYTITYLRWIKA